jgi:hypothetical protein
MKTLSEEFTVFTYTTYVLETEILEIYKSHLAWVPDLLDKRPCTCIKSISYICEKSITVTDKLHNLYFSKI